MAGELTRCFKMESFLVPFFVPPKTAHDAPRKKAIGGADAFVSDSVGDEIWFNRSQGVGNEAQSHNNSNK